MDSTSILHAGTEGIRRRTIRLWEDCRCGDFGHPPEMPSLPALMARSNVRWGIIGCGDVTEVKSGPGLQLAQGSALVAVMRRSGERAADYARRHGVPRWYDKADSLINDPEVDAVYVATPPDSHEDLSLAVARAGKPCYVEKPMARHAAECDRMVAAFRAARLPLFVAYYRRALPRFLAVRDLLESEALGTVTAVNYRQNAAHHLKDSNWRVTAETSGGGHFLDVGSHVIDLIDFLLGPLTVLESKAQRLGPVGTVEDHVSFRFNAGGVPGNGVWNFAAPEALDRLEFTGERGSIRLSVFGDEPVEVEVHGRLERLSRPNPKHVAQPLIQTVVDDLLGRGTCPSTGESALRASRVMDQVLDGYYGGRSDAFWARESTWPGLRMNS